MKTLLLIFSLPLLFLSSCREGPRGPAGSTGPPSEDPTDPNIAPRVVWVWLDSPRPYYRIWDSYSKQSDSLPMGYIPGRLLIRFNKIMVSYTVIPNVTLVPKEDGFAYLSSWGAISIDGQTFELPVYNYFKVAQAYTIKVGKEATDVTNRKLGNDYQKVLVPEPVLRIVNIYPEPNDTTISQFNNYYVYFNSPIDSNSIKNNITISPYVSGRWESYYYDMKNMVFYPDSGYKCNTWYEITFSTGLRDTFNNFLLVRSTVRFKTVPFRVSYNYPSDGQQNVSVTENISCYFSAYIDASSVRSAFSISPSMDGKFFCSSMSFAFAPYQNLLPDTIYTVTIGTSLRSMAGDTLKTPYVFSFKTGS